MPDLEVCEDASAWDAFVAQTSDGSPLQAWAWGSLKSRYGWTVRRYALREGGTMAYSELGAYRYLVRMPLDEAPHDRHFQAVQRLADYDRERRTQLLDTLERYLRDRRSIATTARALYVHPNTLRQRLNRIEELSGLDLGAEDLLSLELAVKLMRLRS